MNDQIVPPGFVKVEVDGCSPGQAFRYTGFVMGERIDILEVHHKVVDFSLYVNNEIAFTGLREDQAKSEIIKLFKELQANHELR